jgi:hypothetical protein
MPKRKIRKPNQTYELPKECGLKPDTKRILTIDPGSRNMGISVVAVNGRGRLKVVANAIVTDPLFDLTKLGPQSDVFMSEIGKWVDLYKPNGIVIERFQTRGLLGPLVEIVSVMIGLIRGQHPNIPIKAITAATWKNEFARRHGKGVLDELYKLSRTTPHQLDSALIGVFGLEKGLRQIFEYDPRDIVRDAELSSLVRLINRKRP